MRRLLARPFPLEPSAARQALRALLFGLFVALFLGFFQPFGLHAAPRLWPLALGYGAVCSAVMLLLNVAAPRLLRNWFVEGRWTVGRELGWTLLNMALIGLANAVFSALLGLMPFTAAILLRFTGLTLAVGVFPVVVAVLLAEARYQRRHGRHSAAINHQLAQAPPPPPPPPTAVLHLPGEGGAPALALPAGDLLYLRSADNYVEVFHQQGAQVRRTVVRGSLKGMAAALPPGRYLRCHKQYVVDLQRVHRVSGNAQGLRLHLAGVEEPIPVSRQLTATVRQQLTAGPGSPTGGP